MKASPVIMTRAVIPSSHMANDHHLPHASGGPMLPSIPRSVLLSTLCSRCSCGPILQTRTPSPEKLMNTV